MKNKKLIDINIQCDFCGSIFPLEYVKKIQAKLVDQFIMLYICPTCYKREKSEKKYIMKRFKLGAGGLKNLIMEFKQITFGPLKASLKIDSGKIREHKIELLEKAIELVWLNVKKAKGIVEGDEEPPKIRYLRLLGYLLQVLDGLLKNYELNELEERLRKAEEELVKIEASE
jgi:uncharacterized protein YlaI